MTKIIRQNEIFIKGARSNNLRNVDLSIPKNKLVVVTGLSGSGKSTLTIDTLFAEGQRRYVESLSSYARQFLGRIKKPDLDYVTGLCPAIAIEQKVSTSNARSTVGTLSEVYDYLRLFFARVGRTFSPVTGLPVTKHSVTDVVNYINGLPERNKVYVVAPIEVREGLSIPDFFGQLTHKGFSRILNEEGEIINTADYLETLANAKPTRGRKPKEAPSQPVFMVLIDRIMVKKDDKDLLTRAADSVQLAFAEATGRCIIKAENQADMEFSNKFEADGIVFEEPNHNLFNYNNPFGACPTCEGYGQVLGIDPHKVIPNAKLSVLDECIVCWKGEQGSAWRRELVKNAHHVNFPVHRAYEDLTKEERKILWKGTSFFKGIDDYFKEIEGAMYKIQNRVMMARYRGKTSCPSCEGFRLRDQALYVKVGGAHIGELVKMSIDDLCLFFENLELSSHEQDTAKRLLIEIKTRLKYMQNLGLGYLQLDRASNSLSGGETQRINLTRTLGSNLTSTMYILDEPSVGLHPRDTARLVRVLKELRDLGNTVIVVEHEEDIIEQADYLIDVGPLAGVHGGNIVWAGNYSTLLEAAPESLTAQYMTRKMRVTRSHKSPTPTEFISIRGASENNLRDIDVDFPLNCLCVISGVSGSGKTTLVKQILYPALCKYFDLSNKESIGAYLSLEGSLKSITTVEYVSQSPIGKSSRSNPISYVKGYDAIRNLLADQKLSQLRGYKPGHFSFNVEGGRCETCQGEGEVTISMQFLADIRLTCEDCKGQRFKTEVLEVQYNGKNIYEILDLSIEEALDFFKHNNDILAKIKPLFDVGLGYVKLGQSSSSLSGGEAQRVKLASYLGSKSNQKILFIFDEPTTGLHFHDVQRLLNAFDQLIQIGHSVLIVEHNLDVIRNADWVIDLGPDAGINGGQLVYAGIPSGLKTTENSQTGRFLE